MFLQKVEVKNFRSIIHETLEFHENIKTLVGANEHGKSNFLSAIRLLNLSQSFSDDDYRRDKNANKHVPDVKFSLQIPEVKRKRILKALNEKGVVDAEGKERRFTLKQIPENFVFRRYIDEEESKAYYTLNITDKDVKDSIYDEVKAFGKKIVFFDDFDDRLESKISRQDIKNASQDSVNSGLMKVCKLENFKDEIFEDNVAAARKAFKDAPSKISKAVQAAWYQGAKDKITIEITKDSTSENLFIEVSDGSTYVSFTERSRGFKWFLSFFLKYRAHHDGDMTDSIFLIDEPGLFLHPKGQKDLLNYFEVLGKRNQVIYTTHSPFMINRLERNRVAVVEKDSKKGTIINSKSFTSNWRRLRSSLGMVLSDSFYFADKTLIVEGIEDKVYLLSLLKFLAEKRNQKIDINLLSIMDAGGAPNLPPLANLVRSEERPFLVLIDGDSPKIENKLIKLQLKSKEIKKVSDIYKEAVTIQDLLPKNVYEKSVNKYLKKLLESEGRETTNDEFKVTSENKIDKEVDEYSKSKLGLDPPSKFGIAREFEEILEEEKESLKLKEFEKIIPLIDWVIKELELEIKG